MMIPTRWPAVLLLNVVLLLSLSLARPAGAAEVRISAAASLTEALKELVAEYRLRHPEVELLPNFAASGALAKQITAGAPADIYISANPKWMDYLQQQGWIAPGAERILVHNTLVFVGPPDSAVTALADLSTLHRIALCSPQSAPAGKYAEQALTAAGLYAPLRAENKLILAKDVRQALLYADRGEVDGAFVYRTDALLARTAQILFAVPQALYPPVSYPAALTRSGEKRAEAQAFFSFLLGAEGRQVFGKYGFVTPHEVETAPSP